MAYSFRSATEADLLYVTRLHHDTLREYIEPIWGWDESRQDQFVRDWFRPERLKIIQADGDDIGVLLWEKQSDHIFIESISIKPEAQGKGYGKEVILDVLDISRLMGLPLRLQVLKTNTDAKRFYNNLGFTQHKESEHHFHLQIL